MPFLEVVDFVLGGLVISLIVGGLTVLWIKDRNGLKELAVIAYGIWLFAGWAPTILVMVCATSSTGIYIWMGLLTAYILAWMPFAIV